MKRLLSILVYATTLVTVTPVLYAQQHYDIKVSTGNRGITASRLKGELERLHQQQPDKDIRVFFEPGTHYLETPLEISSTLTNGKGHIIFYGDGKATLSGGLPVKVQWEPWKNGIYKAALDLPFQFDQLYINDRQQVRARYPNYDSSAQHYNGTAADAISPARVKTWQHPEGGYVHALHAAEWGGYHYRITGVNADGALQLEGGYQNNRQMGMHHQYRFVENIFEELDAPHEWYYDAAHKILYYKPAAGLDLKKATVTVSRHKEVIVLKGSAAAPVKNVSIEGLRFAHTAPTFMDTREPLLRSDWAIYRGGAILLDGAAYCTIHDCEFDHNGGNAIFLSNYNRHHLISGNHIHDAGASGICFVGNPDAVRSPLFEYNQSRKFEETDTLAGPKTSHYPDSCTAVDNLIYRTGRIEKQSAGIQISMSMRLVISHNTIYDVPRAGINVSEGTWGGHLIEYNDVFNTVLETGDHGAFNSWGRDRWWYPDRKEMDSLAAIHPWMVKQDAMYTNVLYHNRFRCDHGWDIDLDDGSSNYHIYENVCLNGGLKLREGFYRTVENNIMLNNSFHPHVWFQDSHDNFRHNIVTSDYKPIGIRYWGDEIDYNLFPDSRALAAAQSSGTDAHSHAGDPQFVQPATGDYRVSRTSPALAIGFKNFSTTDFGVTSPALKAIAQRPPLPVLRHSSEAQGKIINWKGGKIKNIETLGERSATGLPDNNGVYIVETPKAFNARLQAGDVILKVGNTPVNNIKDLLRAAEKHSGEKVEIFRNQRRLSFSGLND
ncbi:PDZ domain-containing protein [Chitinophaga vietnamensis]|uniref:PDZ domain-containing protein n=1 Tax=Chitinophaga vietnamensis TaxID=2593957 RepID=UPI0011773A54|nr:PDZ domain-containing protein [Chitinophaga vietnamensis]